MDTVSRSRSLRRESSRAEKICWELLRDRRLGKLKFRRQHPIGPYFADFACISRKLVVEVDGEHHAFQVEADARRTAFLEAGGWRVIRFWANEVVTNPEGVWASIVLALEAPHPASPPAGERSMN